MKLPISPKKYVTIAQRLVSRTTKLRSQVRILSRNILFTYFANINYEYSVLKLFIVKGETTFVNNYSGYEKFQLKLFIMENFNTNFPYECLLLIISIAILYEYQTRCPHRKSEEMPRIGFSS